MDGYCPPAINTSELLSESEAVEIQKGEMKVRWESMWLCMVQGEQYVKKNIMRQVTIITVLTCPIKVRILGTLQLNFYYLIMLLFNESLFDIVELFIHLEYVDICFKNNLFIFLINIFLISFFTNLYKIVNSLCNTADHCE